MSEWPIAFFLIGAVELVPLIGPQNQIIFVNPEAVTSMRSPRSTDTVHNNIHCMVFAGSQPTGVVEDCETVKRKLEAAKEKP